MWFTVYRKSDEAGRTGRIFAVVDTTKYVVELREIDTALSEPNDVVFNHRSMCLPKELAREFITRPTKDFHDAVEESILICEAAYC